MPQVGMDDLNTGTLGAAQDTVIIASPSASAVSAQVTGTFSGTITWEGNTDRVGSNWGPIPASKADGSGTTATTAVLTGAPNNVTFVLQMGAAKRLRARCSSYTSGTATVHFNASLGPVDMAPFVTQAVSAVSLPLPTGAALDTTVGTTNTEIGGLTETAPATDIASSGLNGRLQRVAQRITSLIALLPTALISNRLDVNLGAAPATVTVQGGAADISAVAGNPVVIGVVDGSGNARNVHAPANNSQSISQAIAVGPMLFNSSSNDAQRNNTTTVVQASTLTTVQTINTDIINYNGRAFMAHANVTLYNGGSILMKLQMKDANGLFVDIPGATTGTVTSGADLLLNVGPTVWPANSATMFNVNFFLPRNIRLVTTIATASVTFSQSYDLPAS